MTEPESHENYVLVRCVRCCKVLLEVSDATVGIVKKKCDKCRTMNRVRFPLTVGAKPSSIPVDAARKVA